MHSTRTPRRTQRAVRKMCSSNLRPPTPNSGLHILARPRGWRWGGGLTEGRWRFPARPCPLSLVCKRKGGCGGWRGGCVRSPVHCAMNTRICTPARWYPLGRTPVPCRPTRRKLAPPREGWTEKEGGREAGSGLPCHAVAAASFTAAVDPPPPPPPPPASPSSLLTPPHPHPPHPLRVGARSRVTSQGRQYEGWVRVDSSDLPQVGLL